MDQQRFLQQLQIVLDREYLKPAICVSLENIAG